MSDRVQPTPPTARLLGNGTRSDEAVPLDDTLKLAIKALGPSVSAADKAALESLASVADLPALLVKPGPGVPAPESAGPIRSFIDKFPASEWSFRAACSTALSCALGLDIFSSWVPFLPPFAVWVAGGGPLHRYIAAVIAISQTKTTLGETLEGVFIVVFAGAYALALCYLLAPLTAFGTIAFTVAMFAANFVGPLLFGEHLLSRWGLVMPLVYAYEFVAEQKGIAGSLAYTTYIEGGYIGGAVIAVLCLLMPFPRTAHSKLKKQLTATYGLTLHLHSLLSVSLASSDDHFALHASAASLAAAVQASAGALPSLLKFAKWEALVISSIDVVMLAKHVALADKLAKNVLARAALLTPLSAASGGARAAATSQAGGPLLQSVRASASYAHLLSASLASLPATAPPISTLAAARAELKDSLGGYASACGAAFGATSTAAGMGGASASGEAWLGGGGCLAESMLGASDFGSALVDAGAEIESSLGVTCGTAPARPAYGVPFFLPEMSSCRSPLRIKLALRAALMCNMVWYLPAMIPCFDYYSLSPEQKADSALVFETCSEPNSVPGLELFHDSAAWISTGIAVIFTYQTRMATLIGGTSRIFRFIFGTHLGCMWARFCIYMASLPTAGTTAGTAVDYDGRTIDPFILIAMQAAWSYGFYYFLPFGYGAVVAAFTAPILVIPIYAGGARGYGEVDLFDGEGAENAALRTAARNLFCFVGGMIIVVLTLLLQTRDDRAEAALRRSLSASLSSLRGAVDALSASAAPRPVAPMRALLAEAAAEPSLYFSHLKLPLGEYTALLDALEQAWGAAAASLPRLAAADPGLVEGFKGDAAPSLEPIAATLKQLVDAFPADGGPAPPASRPNALLGHNSVAKAQAELLAKWAPLVAEAGAALGIGDGAAALRHLRLVVAIGRLSALASPVAQMAASAALVNK